MYTNVSDDFLTAVNGAEPVYCCKLDFGNDVTVNDLFSVSYSGGSCGDSVAPGGTVIANAKVELSALPASVKKGSSCTLYFGVNGEYAPQGVFTIKKIEKSGERLSITLEDNMAKTEKGYFSSLSYPSTTLKMLSEIATKCGVAFNTSGLTAVTIKDKPEGYTCREIIGYIAGLYGKFAVCDRTGKIIFKWFDTTAVQLSDFCYDTPTVATDDITVGRVVCGDFTAGTGTAITYDCLFMTQNQLNTVQKSLNGFKYRTGEIPLRLGNMLIDAWDMVSITYGGETVKIPAATISMTYNGGLSMTIEAPAEEQSADSESYKSPAQKQAERITADIISAKQALLEKADITELNAQIANLENVYAAKADITELSAQIATIDNLTAKKADVEQLYAKKADIDTLVADTATLKLLKSDVANIDVLLSGKAGTGELTAIKLTAENAEIATALIKDLTAANFRSKTIETDDFTIKSSSGKLQIVRNTIQIKDTNNTVRVQIGEDGKSDYGIYVCDASGKIMFTSYDGLHADGIKSGIIKNDMVADDAHISGSKLDISSIIDGINDDSTYLKSSRVIIDGTEQTINAKFTELTTNIGSIGTRTSALESNLSGFRTTVSETYATKNEVEEIEVGGSNLLLNTKSFLNAVSTTLSGALLSGSASLTDEKYRGLSVRGGAIAESQSVVCRYGFKNFALGETFTFSFFARGNVPELRVYFYGETGYVQVAKCTNSQGETNTNSDGRCNFSLSDEWEHYSVTWTLKQTGNVAIEKWILIRTFNSTIGQEIYVCGCKLEKGNKATDWSPAPEDTDAEITLLSTKQSMLEQTVDGFKTTVESTYATNESVTQKISTVEQKADKISWLVKSGDSASNMELTSEALKIIANTEIKGDVIVGGVIKSTNYSEFVRGSKLDLSNGTFYAQSSTGLITLSGGQINLELLESGKRTAVTTSIYPLFGGTAISNGLGELYLIAEARSSTATQKNRDCYVMFNESGMITANGSYTNSRDTSGNIVRLVALTTANHFHVGSTDISGTTRLICGNGNTIEFCRPNGSSAITPMATLSYSSTTVRLYMPTHFNFGTDESHACVRQQTTGTTSADFVKIGNSTQSLQLIGSSLTSSSTISVSSDARMKNHIADLPSRSENLFDYLDGKSFFYNGDTSTAKNYGFIAQDVLSALQKCGLSTDDFAGFCDINGDGSQYALAYEQFIPIMWNEIKRLRKALSERS